MQSTFAVQGGSSGHLIFRRSVVPSFAVSIDKLPLGDRVALPTDVQTALPLTSVVPGDGRYFRGRLHGLVAGVRGPRSH
jgi:hypothetical protein